MSTNGKQTIQYHKLTGFTRAAPMVKDATGVEDHPSFSFVYTIML